MKWLLVLCVMRFGNCEYFQLPFDTKDQCEIMMYEAFDYNENVRRGKCVQQGAIETPPATFRGDQFGNIQKVKPVSTPSL